MNFKVLGYLIFLKYKEIILIWTCVYMEAILDFGCFNDGIYKISQFFYFQKCKYARLQTFPLNLHAPCTPSYGFYFFCLIGLNFICFFNLSISYFCKCYFRFTM